MTSLKTKFGHPDHADQLLNESIEQLLLENSLCAMASTYDGSSYINTAYFVYTEDLNLYFLSNPTDVHSSNIAKNHSVAIAIWKNPDMWSENLHGIQCFGTCEQLQPGTELINAMHLFLKRFPVFKTMIKHPGEFADGITSRMYAVRTSSLKLIDEPHFGRRNYITLKPIRD